MEWGRAFGLEGRLQVGEQRGLARVAGGEGARAGDLVEAETSPAGALCVLGDAVAVAAMLGHGQSDALPGGAGESASPQLRAHPGVGAEYGGGTGQDPDELRYGATGRLDAPQDRSALIGRGELIVDVEPAALGLKCHVQPVLQGRFTNPLLYF
jgi:hypothetical protein